MCSRGRGGILPCTVMRPTGSTRPTGGHSPIGGPRRASLSTTTLLRNAAWHVTDIFAEMFEDDDRRDGFLDPLSMFRDGRGERIEFATPGSCRSRCQARRQGGRCRSRGDLAVRRTLGLHRAFSAGSGGAKPNDLPDGLTNVIVIGQSMDHDLTRTAPSALAGTATGLGYSLDSVVLLTIAQYVRNLGYEAVPSMNDTRARDPVRARGRARRVRTPRSADHARVRSPASARQDLHRSAAGTRPAEVVRSRTILRRVPPMYRCLPGQGDSRRRAVDRAPQPLEPDRRAQVVGRRREVLQLLDEGQHRLLGLHPGVPVQPRLLDGRESLVGEARIARTEDWRSASPTVSATANDCSRSTGGRGPTTAIGPGDTPDPSSTDRRTRTLLAAGLPATTSASRRMCESGDMTVPTE